MIRLAIIIAIILFVSEIILAASQVSIQGAEVKIQTDTRIQSLEFEVLGSSNTGQCMGLLCAITYPN